MERGERVICLKLSSGSYFLVSLILYVLYIYTLPSHLLRSIDNEMNNYIYTLVHIKFQSFFFT